MKHPIDTSAWGEFLLNDIATLTNGNKFDKNKMSHDKPSINFVSRTGFNNGISDFVDKIDGVEPYPAGAITLALGDSVGSTFVQPKPFYTGQNVGVIEFENKSDKMKQFVAVVLNKVCSTQFSAFKNEINKHFKRDLSIPLPLKPSADPSNYTQKDINWTYMETVMSRVTARAKERLANLPQPTDKQKTPVDTSAWGEFVVGELFELTGIKQVKSQHHVVEDPDGIPFVVQSNKNNMVKMKADKQWLLDNDEPVVEGNAIVLGVTLPVVSYQPYEFGASQVITARSEHLNELRGLFIASVINSFVIPKYSYVYKPGIQKYKQDVIPLPLKPSANPSNYTQEDIDWDYMEHFMQAIENKAHDRLKTLQKSIA